VSQIQRFDRRIRRLLGAAALGVGFAVGAAAAQDVSEPTLEYARDPATVVVSFRETLGGVADADPGPFVTVHGDGRVLVHFPAYMKRGGDYELRLDEQEMRDLLLLLVEHGVLGFDETAARDAKRAVAVARRAAAPSGGAVRVASDTSWTVFEVALERYRPAASRAAPAATRKTIAWPDPRTDAALYPSIAAIRDLAAAEQALRALMERPDLTKVR
jgi:hypothetical protein